MVQAQAENLTSRAVARTVMYTASYYLGDESIHQAILRFPFVILEDPAWEGLFQQCYRQLLETPGFEFAYRIQVRDRTLERLLFITTPSARLAELEFLTESFAKLNQTRADSCLPCDSRATHDAATACPAYISHVPAASRTYALGEEVLMHDFRIFPLVESLCFHALRAGSVLAYQANIGQPPLSRELQRRSRKNLAALQLRRSLPPPLLDHQASLVGRLNQARFLSEEFLCVQEPATFQQVLDRLRDDFARRFGPLGFVDDPIDSDAGEQYRTPLLTGLHSSRLTPLSGMTALPQITPVADLVQWLGWTPPAAWSDAGLTNMQTGAKTTAVINNIHITQGAHSIIKGNIVAAQSITGSLNAPGAAGAPT